MVKNGRNRSTEKPARFGGGPIIDPEVKDYLDEQSRLIAKEEGLSRPSVRVTLKRITKMNLDLTHAGIAEVIEALKQYRGTHRKGTPTIP